MKPASINELKQELETLTPTRLSQLCLRLARFKADNKELLTYLLFEADQPERFIATVKQEMDAEFGGLPKPNLYLTKKSLRKVLRGVMKQIRYTGSKETEVELLIYFCRKVRETRIPLSESPVMHNLYQQQLKKIKKLIEGLHEDLQYDYYRSLEELEV